MAAVDAIVAADYLHHDPLMPEIRGIEALKQLLAGLRPAFPDGRFTQEALLAEGDMAVMRWTFRGTHVIPAPDRPSYSFSGYRFRRIPVRPDRIAGLCAKSGEGAGSSEILGDRERFRNVEAVTLENGDKIFSSTTGTNT